jgi:hypothetical protein
MAEERTFRRRSTRIGGGIILAVSLVLPPVTASLVLSAVNAQANRGFVWLAFVFAAFIILFLFPGFVLMGVHFLRARVVVTPDSITAHNIQGVKVVRRADRQDIEEIRLGSTRILQRDRLRVPFVKLKNGSGFFLEPLYGARDDKPVKPEQMEVLSEIRGILGVGGHAGNGSLSDFLAGRIASVSESGTTGCRDWPGSYWPGEPTTGIREVAK